MNPEFYSLEINLRRGWCEMDSVMEYTDLEARLEAIAEENNQ